MIIASKTIEVYKAGVVFNVSGSYRLDLQQEVLRIKLETGVDYESEAVTDGHVVIFSGRASAAVTNAAQMLADWLNSDPRFNGV